MSKFFTYLDQVVMLMRILRSKSIKLFIQIPVFNQDFLSNRFVARRIQEVSPGTEVIFETMLELEYLVKLKEMRMDKGAQFYAHQSMHCVLRNENYVGDFMDLVKIAMEEFGIEDAEVANNLLFEKTAKDSTVSAVNGRGHQTVYLELHGADGTDMDPNILGKIIIELFEDICPLACKNFIALCSNISGRETDGIVFSYVNCPVHRIVPGGWIQMGDIIDGSGGSSISPIDPSGKFRDESFSVDFGALMGGIVGYSSNEPHANGSQFFITLGPCAWMNNKSVGFGRVVQGFPLLSKLSSMPLVSERPVPEVFIGACGVLK